MKISSISVLVISLAAALHGSVAAAQPAACPTLLHTGYQAAGLVVLGFPSNDFAQEKGSNRETAEFCENTFGVKFPMFGASAVRGRDGQVIANYSSLTRPEDPVLVRAVEQALARR